MIIVQDDVVIIDKETNEALIDIKGWSDESKPTGTLGKYTLADCSTFVEMDTSKMFAWKKATGAWVEMQ